MPNEKLHELRNRLETNLLSLAKEFGSTYPIEQRELRTFCHVSQDVSALYPSLDTLCHYTDAKGIMGILDSGTFWATNIAYLNDPEEFLFAYRSFEKMISKGEFALEEPQRAAFLSGLRTVMDNPKNPNIFIISFSAIKDDLSQFRAYSDDGRGYALEFEPQKLIDAFNKYLNHDEISYLTLRRVQYGDVSLQPFHQRAIDFVTESINAIPCERNSPEQLSAARALGMSCKDYLREAGIVFKQAGYISEKEFRVVLDVHGSMCYPPDIEAKISLRAKNNQFIPYIPFQFLAILPKKECNGYFPKRNDNSGLNKIVTGPRIDYQLAEKSLFYLLRNAGLADIQIVPSKSTYRT